MLVEVGWMIKTILAALGAVVAFGGLLFLLAFLSYRYECRMARRRDTDDGDK